LRLPDAIVACTVVGLAGLGHSGGRRRGRVLG